MLIIKTVFLYFEFVEKIVNAIMIGENKTTSTNGLKKLVAPNNGCVNQ